MSLSVSNKNEDIRSLQKCSEYKSLISLPVELVTTILEMCKVKNFTCLLSIAQCSKSLMQVVFSTPQLWTYVDLELEYQFRDNLQDHHLEALWNRCTSRSLANISYIDLYGNSGISHLSIFSILNLCPSLEEIDIRHCYRVDVVLLEQATRDLTPQLPKRIKLLRIAHSGQSSHYYCGVSLSQEPRSIRQLVFNSAIALERNLNLLSVQKFKLDYVPCMICYDRLSVDSTPICSICERDCPRVCTRCEPRAYRTCAECQYTICVPCDGGHSLDDFPEQSALQTQFLQSGTPFFVYPQCSLLICFEHHGRGHSIRNMVVCKQPCKPKIENTCIKCGFWVCPRSRNCEYEMAALKTLERQFTRCEGCSYPMCGLCINRQEHPCSSCGKCCIVCLDKDRIACTRCGGRRCVNCRFAPCRLCAKSD